MILIDTHIWIWWANNSPELLASYLQAIKSAADGIGLSIFSCWEVAKKIEKESRKPPASRTLILDRPVADWIAAAIRLPGLAIVPLTSEILLESTRLPDDYNLINPDPADQIIIATSRIEGMTLMTKDTKILPYAHVSIWKP